MHLTDLRLVNRPGTGLLANFGPVILGLHLGEDSETEFVPELLALARRVATGDSDVVAPTLLRSLTGLLSELATQDEWGLVWVADARDGLAVVVSGAASVEVRGAGAPPQTIEADPSAPYVARLLKGFVEYLVAAPSGRGHETARETPFDAHLALPYGIVMADGFKLVPQVLDPAALTEQPPGSGQTVPAAEQPEAPAPDRLDEPEPEPAADSDSEPVPVPEPRVEHEPEPREPAVTAHFVVDDGEMLALQGNWVVGREPQNSPEVQSGAAQALLLDDPERAISRVHVGISVTPEQVSIEDLGSANGTRIALPDAEEWGTLDPRTPVSIAPGTTILIGPRKLRFEWLAGAASDVPSAASSGEAIDEASAASAADENAAAGADEADANDAAADAPLRSDAVTPLGDQTDSPTPVESSSPEAPDPDAEQGRESEPTNAHPALALPEPSKQVAQSLKGVADYSFVRSLGEGTRGHYYLAEPPSRLELDEPFVVVKVVAGLNHDDAFRRAVRELRAFAAVESPYLPTVYDAGKDGDRFFSCMQYFPRGSLSSPDRPLERAEVLRALADAARAADALHEAGMVHMGIRPSSVLLGDDHAYLSELDLAKLFGQSSLLTNIGPMEDVEFIDPSLLTGAAGSRESDIWSLGATMYRALTGVSIYGELPEAPLLRVRTIFSSAPALPVALPDEEMVIVRDCIQTGGHARPQTAAELAERIDALLG